MSERLRKLQRIAAAQKRMGELAALRLAAAERACVDLAADQSRLRAYVMEQGPIERGFAKAVLRATHVVDARLEKAGRRRDAEKASRDKVKRHEHAVDAMVETEARAAERRREDRDLAETMEAWLARGGASLP